MAVLAHRYTVLITDSPLLRSRSTEDLLEVFTELVEDTRPLSRVWSQDLVLSRLSTAPVSMLPLSVNSLSHSMLTCCPYTLLTPLTLTGLPIAWTGESHSWKSKEFFVN